MKKPTQPIVGLAILILIIGFVGNVLAASDTSHVNFNIPCPVGKTLVAGRCDDQQTGHGGGGTFQCFGSNCSRPALAPANPSRGQAAVFPDPFDLLPHATSTDPRLARLTLANFSFSQIGEGQQTFDDQGRIRINGRKYLMVALPYDQVPEVLKTIGVTVFDATDYRRSFSFVMMADDAKQKYTATIAPFGRDGLYPINIHILNYQDQSLKKMSGYLLVGGVGFLPNNLATGLIIDVARPLAITSGILAGASSFAALGSVASLYDIYLLLARGLGALLGLLGFRRRRKTWGTVYDAATKRPLDPAYVAVFKDGKEVTHAITDIDGRYGFLLPPGVYELKASKSHYRFPSTFLAGKTEDELYSNLYFGGLVTTTGQEALAMNIPMDPLGFDWNEFAKQEGDFNRFHFKKEVALTKVMRIVYAVGFILALVSVAVAPSLLNFGIILLYGFLHLFRSIHARSHSLVTVKWQFTNEPLPYVIVRVFLADVDQEVKQLVANHLGQIYFLIQPGTYYLTFNKKNPDGSYYAFYKTQPMNLSRGVLDHDIIIPRFKPEPPVKK